MFRCDSKSILTSSEFSISYFVKSEILMAKPIPASSVDDKALWGGNLSTNIAVCTPGGKETLRDTNFFNI